MERKITKELMNQFSEYLIHNEKSIATQKKYTRDVSAFCAFLGDRCIIKETLIEYKKYCIDRGFAVRSINSMLASINSFLEMAGWSDCKVKNIRIQQLTYCTEDKELTKSEYMRLLETARKDEQLSLVLQTICGTGIRVSELRFFTVEMVKCGVVTVDCKNKTRKILIPGKLKKIILNFAKKNKITSGVIFRGRTGAALNRSSIWRKMKSLCSTACVKETKVFPHNLRKLFARVFYNLEKDIAKLADILGHSNVNTTRIYIMTTGVEHLRKLERLGLVI